ncbi:hypothetical protein psal_cds_1251 [Pandoravirus salinus]|uniref:Uncharacterized protein n=1 Tax=Pandoravirus salinus TaxID=1349410 RepID=S4W5F7_9VIRU|nr:hypothetical protein psal_cds_1251 [Pandoravirus salinus]AGO85585.1 hypothetical protein psal_cds_1251 [Pandoravirus salinus]
MSLLFFGIYCWGNIGTQKKGPRSLLLGLPWWPDGAACPARGPGSTRQTKGRSNVFFARYRARGPNQGLAKRARLSSLSTARGRRSPPPPLPDRVVTSLWAFVGLFVFPVCVCARALILLGRSACAAAFLPTHRKRDCGPWRLFCLVPGRATDDHRPDRD